MSPHDEPLLPSKAQMHVRWGQLYGSATSLWLAEAARRASAPLLVIAADARQASRYEDELRFFSEPGLYIESFPDWETLPYDLFSPHPDIVSQRLRMLAALPRLTKGIVIVDLETLLQRLAPHTYIDAHAFDLSAGERLDIQRFRERLAGLIREFRKRRTDRRDDESDGDERRAEQQEGESISGVHGAEENTYPSPPPSPLEGERESLIPSPVRGERVRVRGLTTRPTRRRSRRETRDAPAESHCSPPSDARDLIWVPAQFTWANEGEAVGFMPARYPGSEASADDAIRMSRKTEWRELAESSYAGLGQRLLATDTGEYSLLEVREIAFAG